MKSKVKRNKSLLALEKKNKSPFEIWVRSLISRVFFLYGVLWCRLAVIIFLIDIYRG